MSNIWISYSSEPSNMITFSFFNSYFFGKDLFCFLNSKMDRYIYLMKWWAFQVALVVKNSPANVGRKRHGFDPWVGKIPWRRVWQPPPVFLPGESHGQWILMGYSPWGHMSQTQLKWLSVHTCTMKSPLMNYIYMQRSGCITYIL